MFSMIIYLNQTLLEFPWNLLQLLPTKQGQQQQYGELKSIQTQIYTYIYVFNIWNEEPEP